MAIHDEVLRAAIQICREREDWTFRADEVVVRLPHLNESSVRTHIVSRCCVNAPKNHPHKWDYFERIGRGLYEIRAVYREGNARTVKNVAEGPTPYRSVPLRDTIHAVAHREQGFYIGECLEIALVTQGRTLDELISNLEEAIDLHLEGEDSEAFGLKPELRLALICEIPVRPYVPKT